jgi:hypothetical protein
MDKFFQIKSGDILYHAKDRDDVCNKISEINQHCAIIYTGEIPEGVATLI